MRRRQELRDRPSPSSQHSSQMPANRPTDRQVHQTLDSQSMPRQAAETATPPPERDVPAAGPAAGVARRASVAIQADLYLSLP